MATADPLTVEEINQIARRMDIWGDYGPDPSETIERLIATVRSTRRIMGEDELRDIIALSRPAPTTDHNGDTHCTRLWPMAQCQWTFGHYGGCSSA